jgi:NADPH-dependent curcumin reductase CurA
MNRQVVLKSRPVGIPEAEHFDIVETPIPEVGDGQVLVRNLYLSVDPAMRGWVNAAANYQEPVSIGAVMRSLALGQVTASRNTHYAVGDLVTGMFGWQDYACVDASIIDRKVEETDLPISTALGILGLTGLTAYLALLNVGKPRAGETVVVSAAAGSVGSCVGQIAKISGCRTVGIAGGPEKVRLCRTEFGYDEAVDYKKEDLAHSLRAACGEGLDVYFDNTSGVISDTVMKHLRIGARVVICGTTSVPAWDPIPYGPRVERHLLVKRARMQGFLFSDHADHFEAARQALAQWLREGRLHYREDILVALGQAPGSIAGLYRGENLGKRLIRLAKEMN